MKRLYSKSLFLFRRDLRLEDNTGLIFALSASEEVIPAFIFTPEQIEKNPYRSDRCLQFMIESLEELHESLMEKRGKLHLFFGKTDEVVGKCIRNYKIDAIIVNRDYTPYSIERDKKIESVCTKLGANFHTFDDALLHPPEIALKKDGKPYTVFTPYFRNASRIQIEKPANQRSWNFSKETIEEAEGLRIFTKILPERRTQSPGGRKAGLKILKRIGAFEKYDSERDFPAIEGTTHLSPHMKFTTCSPREAYFAMSESLGKHSGLIRSLYWRDFFTSICFFFPKVFGASFHEKFDKLHWSYDQKHFGRWCEGSTGFPIVDAGMRELNESGYMHNRVRMIVASFLVKDLHIDWRWGEKYFARFLIDYDPAVNNGNWQWAASTGCDAQPYFRIFNPWSQQIKFDPDCKYIKKWVPELAEYTPDIIHNWFIEKSRPARSRYPAPMIEHGEEAKKTLMLYKKIGSHK